jgi:hypothetical protein
MCAASEARKTTTGATSSGSIQGTPSGVLVARMFRACSSSADDPVGALPLSSSTWAQRSWWLIHDTTRHQPNRGEHDSRAPIHRRLPALPWRSWTFSRSATMSTTKRRWCLSPVGTQLVDEHTRPRNDRYVRPRRVVFRMVEARDDAGASMKILSSPAAIRSRA